ncbi:hypothetical protein ACGFYQ_13140 [Streptomyces sp. NPDC048258]|uniref:hypothetical protein n=1 Tax=Streptomyces sp. NPDC048258 TaxID=3365527 RepID=UPI00371B8D8B
MSTANEAPIYAQLIRERGDVPGQTRREAEQIHRELARVLGPAPWTAAGGGLR